MARILIADAPAYLDTSYCHGLYHSVSGYVKFCDGLQLAGEGVMDR